MPLNPEQEPIKDEAVYDASDFGSHSKEILDTVIDRRQPVLVTREGKVAALILPITDAQLVRKILESPEGQRMIAETNAAFANGETMSATEAFGPHDVFER